MEASSLDLREPDRTALMDINRTRLRVWEWGHEDAPAVICAHGAHDHGRMWDGFAPRLADLGYRVVALDLRGHGDSGRFPHGHIWGMTSMDVAMLARELGPPVGTIGHSWGAGLSMFAAAVWPELFKWFVNLDGLGPPGDFADEERADLATNTANSLDWAEKVLLGPPRLYASIEEMVDRRAQTNHRLPRKWVEHLVRHGAQPAEGGFAWKADGRFRVGLPGDFDIDYLKAEHELVRCPVLVLTGSEPDTWSDHSPDVIAERLAYYANTEVRHEVIEEAGHYVHIEQPEAVLDAIARFLKEVDA